MALLGCCRDPLIAGLAASLVKHGLPALLRGLPPQHAAQAMGVLTKGADLQQCPCNLDTGGIWFPVVGYGPVQCILLMLWDCTTQAPSRDGLREASDYHDGPGGATALLLGVSANTDVGL
jgi:hypothetical protein